MEAKETKEIRLSKKDVLEALRDWINRHLEIQIDDNIDGEILYCPDAKHPYDSKVHISHLSGAELKITKPIKQKKLRDAG